MNHSRGKATNIITMTNNNNNNNVTVTTVTATTYLSGEEEEEEDFYNNSNYYYYYNEKDISSLSTTQQKILSLAVLIPSILSIVGSSIILHLVVKERRRHQNNTTSPYRRILFMLSLCDIIATINYGLSPYLMPSSSSTYPYPNPNAWVWAVGNQATCTMLGTITQFGFSTQFYCGMLSLYFVLTIRKGMKQPTFSKFIEPYCHVGIMLFSITTASVGAVMGFYDVVGLGQGCWVNNWPDKCGSDPEDTGGDCKSEFIAWIFGGLPAMTMLLVIVVNNLLLYCHVRSTILRGSRYSSFTNNVTNVPVAPPPSPPTTTATRGSHDAARSSSSSSSSMVVVASASAAVSQSNSLPQQQQQQQEEEEEGVHHFHHQQQRQDQHQVVMSTVENDQRPQNSQLDQPDRHHQQQQRSTRPSFTSSFIFPSSIISSLRPSSSSSPSTRRQQQRQHHRRSRQSGVDPAQLQRIRAVGTQSFLYVSAYLLTYVFSWTIRIAESLNVSASDSSKMFPLLLLQSIFLPSQGFLNLLVYLRPPYLRSRKSFPRETRFWCVRRALYGQTVRPQKPSDDYHHHRDMLDTQSCSKVDIVHQHHHQHYHQQQNDVDSHDLAIEEDEEDNDIEGVEKHGLGNPPMKEFEEHNWSVSEDICESTSRTLTSFPSPTPQHH